MGIVGRIGQGVKNVFGTVFGRFSRVGGWLGDDRMLFVAGPVMVGYTLSRLLDAEFPLRLAAAVFFGSYAALQVRDMSFEEGKKKVYIGEFRIAKDLQRIIGAITLSLLTALMADANVAFAVAVLILLLFLYADRMMPEGATYARFREIPVVGEALLGSILSVFLVFALYFHNQLAAGPEMIILLFVLAARFTVWEVIPEEEEDEDRLNLGEPEPPTTMIEVHGGGKTKKVLMGLAAVSAVLFYALAAVDYLNELAWFAGLAYLAGFVLIAYMTPKNKSRVAKAVPAIDTYLFIILMGVGWAVYTYILEAPPV